MVSLRGSQKVRMRSLNFFYFSLHFYILIFSTSLVFISKSLVIDFPFFADHGLQNGGENHSFLHLPEYRVKIPIHSGGVLLMEPAKTQHFTTCVSQGENMIGIALSQKQKVFNKINRLNDSVSNKRARQ